MSCHALASRRITKSALCIDLQRKPLFIIILPWLWLHSQPHLFCFCVILFNRLTQEEISGFCVPPSLICLLELYVCLLVVHSSIHPSTSKQYTMFPRQDVIVAVLQRIIRLNLSIQRKRELNLLIRPCRLLLSCSIVPHRNSKPHPLFLFPLVVSSPHSVSPFPSSFTGELIGGVCQSFILPASHWASETMGRSPLPPRLTADLREGNCDSNNAAVMIHNAWFLSAFNCFSYLLSSAPLFFFCFTTSYLPDVC